MQRYFTARGSESNRTTIGGKDKMRERFDSDPSIFNTASGN